jgi:hypothetical protein
MKHIFVICMGLCLGFFCTSCGRKAEKFGEAPDELSPKIPITTILFSPEGYIGKEVVIEGVIATECPTGGWIRVEDSEGHTIYVEFHGTSFAPIPQRTGKRVIVKGIVFQGAGKKSEIELIGKGVLIP